MEKKIDVVALGELLIDFTENGASEQGNAMFEANPGGAPCNVLAMLTKLQKKCAFVGKVGSDMFGMQLRCLIEEIGIDVRGLQMDEDVRTTLAFVKTFPNGDRDFSFYRNPGADMMLREDEIPEELIRDARIFHFGTLSMTQKGVEKATKHAVKIAKEAGSLISFDPNLRPPLWDTMEHAKMAMCWGLSQCDILKISDNELEFLTGKKDFDEGVAILKRDYPNITMLNVTAGADGSYAYYGTQKVYVPGYRLGGTIETTGAGDTFCANVLNFVLENGLEGLDTGKLTQMLCIANAAAYLVTTKKGAIKSMPECSQIMKIVEENRQI